MLSKTMPAAFRLPLRASQHWTTGGGLLSHVGCDGIERTRDHTKSDSRKDGWCSMAAALSTATQVLYLSPGRHHTLFVAADLKHPVAMGVGPPLTTSPPTQQRPGGAAGAPCRRRPGFPRVRAGRWPALGNGPTPSSDEARRSEAKARRQRSEGEAKARPGREKRGEARREAKPDARRSEAKGGEAKRSGANQMCGECEAERRNEGEANAKRSEANARRSETEARRGQPADPRNPCLPRAAQLLLKHAKACPRRANS